jgi:hypothetical protein
MAFQNQLLKSSNSLENDNIVSLEEKLASIRINTGISIEDLQ